MHKIVLITAPSKQVAKSLACNVLNRNLAACINIVPQITSIYRWNAEIEESEEVLMLVKTRDECLDQLKEMIIKEHPYDVPEFIALDIQSGHEPYLKWITDCTSLNPDK